MKRSRDPWAVAVRRAELATLFIVHSIGFSLVLLYNEHLSGGMNLSVVLTTIILYGMGVALSRAFRASRRTK